MLGAWCRCTEAAYSTKWGNKAEPTLASFCLDVSAVLSRNAQPSLSMSLIGARVRADPSCRLEMGLA